MTAGEISPPSAVAPSRRSSIVQGKPRIVFGSDFEERVDGVDGTSARADPLADMLLVDQSLDVQVMQVARRDRTVQSTVPSEALQGDEGAHLFQQECIKFYTTKWHVVNRRDSEYSRAVHGIASSTDTDIEPQRFEIDESTADAVQAENTPRRGRRATNGNFPTTPIIEGLLGLHKVTNSAITPPTAKWKRRWATLRYRSPLDGGLAMEIYKSDKKAAVKETIDLDNMGLPEPLPRERGGDPSFSIRLGGSILALHCCTDRADELDDWIEALKAELQVEIDPGEEEESRRLDAMIQRCEPGHMREISENLETDSIHDLINTLDSASRQDLFGIYQVRPWACDLSGSTCSRDRDSRYELI